MVNIQKIILVTALSPVGQRHQLPLVIARKHDEAIFVVHPDNVEKYYP